MRISGMQKNHIVFKMNCKYYEMSKELINVSDIAKNSQYADDVKLTLKFVKIPFCTTNNYFYLSAHEIPIKQQNEQVLNGFWRKILRVVWVFFFFFIFFFLFLRI